VLKRLVFTAFFLIINLSVLVSLGQREDAGFPESGLTIIVPYAEGGGTDTTSRAIAKALEKILNRPVRVENRLGGSGAVGLIAGAAAVPDGYTLTMTTREIVSLPALGLAQISREDFSLLGLINKEAAVLVVASGSPWRSLDELFAYAASEPGKLRFASAAKPHFYILELENRLGVQFNKIPYNGAAKAIPAVADGQADFTLANPGELKDWLDTGEVRALGIMDEFRSSSMPDVPTFRELGIDITSYTWRGLAAPVDTPPEVLSILEKAVEKACGDPEFIAEMERAQYSLHYMNAYDFKEFLIHDEMTIREILRRISGN
jgi:tripartite-type tricarboxylate transporter receptor subunit TctC